jgi:3-oxoacyl-[acyl-carrier-protein] synthase-3
LPYAAIGPIEVYLPDRIETNDELAAEHPEWAMDLIGKKTGIYRRHIAAPEQCASDLAFAATRSLFANHNIEPASIDFLLLCTQTPDYPLPTTACLLQERLGLRTSIGAIDFNLGCSGFVYGLSLADGLIQSGAARRVLLITAETYTKYIDADDRSLRPIFGDAAAATMIEAAEQPTLRSFVFGTDGGEANTLMVDRGGARAPEAALKPSGRRRWKSPLYMDGPGLLSYTAESVPPLFEEVLRRGGITKDDLDYVLIHQATRKMIDQLRERIDMDEARWPLALADYGNTVSSTLPILIRDLRRDGRLRPGMRSLLLGFGVGYSAAACLWRESLG